MLSNFLINSSKFVLIVDQEGKFDRFSNKFVEGWLQEQGQVASCLKTYSSIKEVNQFVAETENTEKANIILPNLSDLQIFLTPTDIFQLVNGLIKSKSTKQVFLWAVSKNVPQHFLLPYLEYMAQIVVALKPDQKLSILTKKAGGLVTNKLYTYKVATDDFLVEAIKTVAIKVEAPVVKPENLGTFKIDLDEDELVARNALKLPYEHTSEPAESNIIYTPDADDDFDDEDPDEDLYI